MSSELSSDELFHLGLKATQEGNRESSLSLLKRFIDSSPENIEKIASAHMLLGAEYADISMIDEAVNHFEKSVEVVPTLWTAHFQLGQLYFLQKRADDAQNAWQPLLDEFDDSNSLYNFANGFLALTEDKLNEAIEHFNKGLQTNNDNPALFADIERLVEKLSNSSSTADQSKEEAPSEPEQSLNNVLLNRYSNSKH